MPRLPAAVDARRAAHRGAAPLKRRGERPWVVVRCPQGAGAVEHLGSFAMEVLAAMEESDPVAAPRYRPFVPFAAVRAAAEYAEQGEIPLAPAAVATVGAGLAE